MATLVRASDRLAPLEVSDRLEYVSFPASGSALGLLFVLFENWFHGRQRQSFSPAGFDHGGV